MIKANNTHNTYLIKAAAHTYVYGRLVIKRTTRTKNDWKWQLYKNHMLRGEKCIQTFKNLNEGYKWLIEHHRPIRRLFSERGWQ